MEVSRAAAPADPSPQKRECTKLDTARSTAPELAPRTRGCTGQEASWQGPGRVAPRARGCARAVQVEENHAAVSPARAGMHHAPRSSVSDRMGFPPHTRGRTASGTPSRSLAAAAEIDPGWGYPLPPAMAATPHARG